MNEHPNYDYITDESSFDIANSDTMIICKYIVI